jgi:hypothetical protein
MGAVSEETGGPSGSVERRWALAAVTSGQPHWRNQPQVDFQQGTGLRLVKAAKCFLLLVLGGSASMRPGGAVHTHGASSMKFTSQ